MMSGEMTDPTALNELRGAIQRAEALGLIHLGDWLVELPDGRVRAAQEPDVELAGRALCASDTGYRVIFIRSSELSRQGCPVPGDQGGYASR